MYISIMPLLDTWRDGSVVIIETNAQIWILTLQSVLGMLCFRTAQCWQVSLLVSACNEISLRIDLKGVIVVAWAFFGVTYMQDECFLKQVKVVVISGWCTSLTFAQGSCCLLHQQPDVSSENYLLNIDKCTYKNNEIQSILQWIKV